MCCTVFVPCVCLSIPSVHQKLKPFHFYFLLPGGRATSPPASGGGGGGGVGLMTLAVLHLCSLPFSSLHFTTIPSPPPSHSLSFLRLSPPFHLSSLVLVVPPFCHSLLLSTGSSKPKEVVFISCSSFIHTLASLAD